MKLEKYTLYLDESVVDNDYFTLAGVVVKSTQASDLRARVDDLKMGLWPNIRAQKARNIILHQMVARQVNRGSGAIRQKLTDLHGSEYAVFAQNVKYGQLLDGIGGIVDGMSLPIIGSTINCVAMRQINSQYASNGRYYTALQIIMESFCQAMMQKSGRGSIIIESRRDDQNNEVDMKVQRAFFNAKAHGTLLMSPDMLQKHLNNIMFRQKTLNDPALQIADFIPNNFARKAAGKDTNQINRILLNHRYDGGVSRPDYFGVRTIPFSF